MLPPQLVTHLQQPNRAQNKGCHGLTNQTLHLKQPSRAKLANSNTQAASCQSRDFNTAIHFPRLSRLHGSQPVLPWTAGCMCTTACLLYRRKSNHSVLVCCLNQGLDLAHALSGIARRISSCSAPSDVWNPSKDSQSKKRLTDHSPLLTA